MDLFVVNRYEENQTIQRDEKKSIEKLLKKVEKRKKSREALKLKKAFPPKKLKKEKDNTDKNDASIKPVVVAEQPKIDEDKSVKPNANNEISKDYTVIGTDSFTKKPKVKRVLPKWLSNPKVVSVNLQNLTTQISDIASLDEDIQTELKKDGLTHMFPVQAEVVPYLNSECKKPKPYWPMDICVSAPTGSGKTLAFVLPIIQALKHHLVRHVRALVVLPVQELALQVFKVFRRYAESTKLKVVLATASRSFNAEQSAIIKTTKSGAYKTEADIIVATPGRLVEHLVSTKGLSFKHLRFLIIDEADRVIDNVQNDWLHHLEQHIHAESPSSSMNRLNISAIYSKEFVCQKLFFSATLSQDPEKLQKMKLFQPRLFTSVVKTDEDETEETNTRSEFIGKYTTPSELTEQYLICEKELKPLVLYNLIKTLNSKRILCFTNSVLNTHRLALLLKNLSKDEFKVAEISGSLKTQDRNNVVKAFSNYEIDVLISTDALARGIDLETNYVISYDIPKFIKNYIHRVGRTGRAGKKGTAITMVTEKGHSKFLKMLKTANKNINKITYDEDEIENLNERFQEAMLKLREQVEKEEKEKLDKSENIKKKNLSKNKKRRVRKNKPTVVTTN